MYGLCWSNDRSSYFHLQVEYETQSTDSFMANWSSVLTRLAEPFMDASYTKVSMPASKQTILTDSLLQLDKIDSQYYLNSSRINVKDETRIKADAQEIEEWQKTAAQNRTRVFSALLPQRMILTDAFKQIPQQTLFPKSST